MSLLAGRDLVLQTQAIPVQGTSATNSATAGSTSLGHVATVQGGSITLQAARDLVAQGAQVASAGDLTALAGRNLQVGATTTTYQFSAASHAGDTIAVQQSGSTQHGSTLSAGGDATLVAQGGALTVQASQVSAGHDATLSGQDVTIAAGVNSARDATQLQWSAGHASLADSSQSAAAAGVSAGNHVTVQATGNGQAGSGDLTVTGAGITATQGQATLQAAHDLNVGTLALAQSSSAEVHSESHGFLSHGSVTSDSSSAGTTQQGSTVSGNTVAMAAGNDLGVSGSNVAGTGDVALQAGNNVNITAATNTASSSTYYEADQSGLFSSGMGFTVGHSRQTDQTHGNGTTQSSSRSLVGSTSGNLAITAGNAATVSGSDLAAGISNGQAAAGAGSGNLSIDAKTITIDPGADQQQTSEHQTFSQSGLSVGLGGAVVNAQQSMDQVAQAAQSSSDARVKALAGATAGLAAYNATQAVSNDAVSLSVTVGSSHSDSTSSSASLTHDGSTLNAAGNVDLNAHGGGQDSKLTITGSQVNAGGNVNLSADNAVTLQAAQDTTSSQSTSHGSSSAVGLGISAGSSGWAAGVTASASASKSNGNGSSLTQQDTTVNAGQTLAIHSGGDTTLAGAVASGRQVTADVGGNLNIQSLQDTASEHDSSHSVGGSVTAGFGFSASASAGSQKIDADYASVQQQSGLEAGDGGFQIHVKGNTGLVGGVIESSQAAVDQGRNRLITGTLTTASVANRGSYSGQSLGVSAGLSAGPGQSGQASTNGGAPQATSGPNHEASFGNSTNVGLPTAIDASGSGSSTTQSGISGGAITITNAPAQQQLTGQTAQQAVEATNRGVTTGTNTAHAIANPYDASQVQAAFTVTQAFTQQVGQFLATKASQATAAQKALAATRSDPDATPQQIAQAQQQADAAALWAPGGTYNRILTAFTAAAGGNATGGATQLVQAAAVGYLQGLGAQQVKALAEGFESAGQPNATSEAVRTALQALVGCAGAQAATGSCSAGAMGAAASVVLNDALDAAQGVSAEKLSATDKRNRQNLVGSLVAGIAAQAGVYANAASGSAQVETGNNALLSLPEPTPLGFVPLPVSTPLGIPGQQAPSPEDQLLHPYGKPNQSGLNDNTGTTLPGWVSSVGDFLTSLPSEAGSALHKLVNTPMITPSACAMSVMFCGATAMLSASGGNATDTAVTSEGTANAATLQGLKGQLVNENLANIAAQDPRLATALNGSGTSNPNFSIGAGTAAEANALGQAWVGDGATLVSNQAACPGCLVSADGTMIYRPPQPKSSPFATTGVQANFVRQTPSGTIISNGHLNVTP